MGRFVGGDLGRLVLVAVRGGGVRTAGVWAVLGERGVGTEEGWGGGRGKLPVSDRAAGRGAASGGVVEDPVAVPAGVPCRGSGGAALHAGRGSGVPPSAEPEDAPAPVPAPSPAGRGGAPLPPALCPAVPPLPTPTGPPAAGWSPEALFSGPSSVNPGGSGPSWSKISISSSSGPGSGSSSAAAASAFRAPVAVRKRASGSGCSKVATTCHSGSGMPWGAPGVP